MIQRNIYCRFVTEDHKRATLVRLVGPVRCFVLLKSIKLLKTYQNIKSAISN